MTWLLSLLSLKLLLSRTMTSFSQVPQAKVGGAEQPGEQATCLEAKPHPGGRLCRRVGSQTRKGKGVGDGRSSPLRWDEEGLGREVMRTLAG